MLDNTLAYPQALLARFIKLSKVGQRIYLGMITTDLRRPQRKRVHCLESPRGKM
jgi:hypothetical protein